MIDKKHEKKHSRGHQPLWAVKPSKAIKQWLDF
jgi:hypothetical protein